MEEILFASVSQFGWERCIINTSFTVSVTTPETVRQLIYVKDKKIPGSFLVYLASLSSLLNRANKHCVNSRSKGLRAKKEKELNNQIFSPQRQRNFFKREEMQLHKIKSCVRRLETVEGTSLRTKISAE